MTNIPMTNKKFNCSKAFLLAAGFFASFAGTALADDDYKFSSGTITNDGEKTFACDESNWGTDCKDIGLLFGLPESIYDSDKNAFLAWSEDTETYKGREYDSFNAIFWLSGDAQYTNEETGTITFSCTDEDGHFSYTENSEEIVYTLGEDVVLISDNASFVNKGEVVFDYDKYILLALTDSATFENSSNGEISGLEGLYMFGDAHFENKGNITSDTSTDIEIYNNGRLVNEGEISISYTLYTRLSGNASFVNEGKLSSVDNSFLLLDFWSYEDGDASFVNKANGVISGEDFDVEFWFSSDYSLYGGVEKIPDTFTGTFENYGTITLTGELEASFWIDIYEDSADAAKSIYENFDPAGKAFFKNYGTITAENVIISSPVETTLAQGSQIVGNLTLGDAAGYGIFIENDDAESHRYLGTYVTNNSVLNIVLNGSSETPLISGNLTLLNTTELNVSVDPDSETAEIYTVTLWGGELVYGKQTIYSEDDDGQYTEGETIEGSFAETSGTFVVGDETFNWSLDISTGVLTARSENLNDPADAGYKISSGTYVNEGDLTYACNKNNWGADCKDIGLLFGLSSSTYDSEKNAFLDWTGDSHREYIALNAIFWLLGDAQYTNMGTITFSCPEGYHESETESGGYIDYVYGYDFALISGNASFVNEGTITFDGYVVLALAENATFENAEDGKIKDPDAVYICGSATFVNNGTISDDFYAEIHDNGSFVNNGELSLEGRFSDLYGNASFVNEGQLVASSYSYYLYFNGDEDGNASFVNKEAGTITSSGFSVGFCFEHEYDTDCKISNNSTGTFENYGEITLTDSDKLWVDFYFSICEVSIDTAREVWEGFTSTNKTFFKNYGKITVENVVIDSPVETTLAQGSQIVGNLTLGNAASYDVHVHNYSQRESGYSHEYNGTYVTEKSVLNIVLNDSSETPLISGNLTLLNTTELNVSVDPDSTVSPIYTVTLWGGELVLGEQTISSYAYEAGEGISETTETITGSFVSTSGTFVIEGETFNWSLDTSTGVLTAKSENIEEEVEITDPDQSVSLGKNDVAIFETESFEGTISGSGGVYSGSDLSFSGDASEHTGTTYVQGGTFTIEEGAQLGSGSYEISSDAVLEIASDREFTNATSGNGTLSIASGAEVSFTKNVGVRVIYVKDGATLKSGATLTHSDTLLILAGELSLDASAGEQVSFTNGGTVTIEDTATLNLSSSGVAPASVRTLSNSSGLGAGSNVTIFSGATVEGNVARFLATDSTLSDLADDYAVVYDTSKGLSITILESGNVSSISSGLKLHDGLGSDFVSAVISADDLDFGTGIKSSDELQSLSNPIVRAIATGNLSEAAAVLDTLSPLSYAAMVAMPTTSFYNDVKTIDNRLAARRGKLDENARWEFFAQAQGTFIENDDANDTQTFDFDLYGVLAGADYRVNEGLTVGLTVGYDYGKADIHNSGGKIESDDVRVTIFAGQQIGEMFFVNAGAQVGYGHYEAKRKTAYGNANGDTDGWNAGVFADVGMMLTLSEELRISARPYVGIAYMHSEVGSFDDGLLDVDDFHGDSLRASIGCGVFWGFDLAETVCSVGLDASYSHDFCGDEVDIDGKVMSTNKGFGTTAKALSENLFSVGPVVSVAISESVGVFASYAFEAGTDSSTGHSVNAGVSVSF